MSYGCESWSLKSTDEESIKRFKMKAFRQILRVTWTDKRTNDWVLRKAGTEPFATVSQEKKAFLLWSSATERRKLYGERNNAKYYTSYTLAG